MDFNMHVLHYEESQNIYHDQVLIGILKTWKEELESLTHYPSEKKENVWKELQRYQVTT